MTGNILLIDDLPQNIELLFEILLNQGYKVRCAISGSLALKAIESVPPDLILLDVSMPDMDGYEVCRKLKDCVFSRTIPVIFVSALGETLDKVKAFESGGVDYITKPFQIDEVLARISTHLALKQTQAELNMLNAQLEQRVIERTTQLQEEMKERRRAQEQLLYWATHDELTGFFNLSGLTNVLEQVMMRVQFQTETYAVLTLLCANFQQIINAFGHVSGDQLLLQISHYLTECLSCQSVIARVSSDKFVILLEGLPAEKNMAQQSVLEVVRRVQNKLTQAFKLEQNHVFIQIKWGIVLGRPHYSKSDHILRDADIACYHTFSQGLPVSEESRYVAAAYRVFDTHMHDKALKRIHLESNLRQAIERQEFVVNYQPIISLATGEISGMEALVRWQHPTLGFISPREFIPVAEASGMIIPLGMIVLRQACIQHCQWQQQHRSYGHLKMSVNLSVKQFAQPDLVKRIQQVLLETGLKPENLKLEITESAIMNNAEAVAAILADLRSHKIQLAIDDFGTGYSSLSYLTQFPVDTLKIDRAFVSQLNQDPKHVGLLQAIVTLAHTLGMDIVAEGIETDTQLKQLRRFGCQFGQGYLFSKPLDSQAMAQLLTQPTWAHYWRHEHVQNAKVR